MCNIADMPPKRKFKLPCPLPAWNAYRHARINHWPGVPRNYALSAACETPQRKAARTHRHRNRRRLRAAGLVRPFDGKVIHHLNSNPFDNRPSNLLVMTASAHRRHHNVHGY